jgi:hypothetical protein
LNPNRELKERFGDARREYDVEREPVKGVNVRVRVYGKVEMGVAVAEDLGSVAAGSVLNRSPVDMPIKEETGE